MIGKVHYYLFDYLDNCVYIFLPDEFKPNLARDAVSMLKGKEISFHLD